MFIKKIIFIILFSNFAYSQIVYTTLPEFSWVVRKLSPQIDVKSLLNGNEDPHYVDASPSFVFKLAKAQLVIFNGLDLEVGWLPKVIEQTGNKLIQNGAIGQCDASSYVDKIEKIENYDRSLGDVHPQGNPHYTISLAEMKKVIKKIKECLSTISDSSILDKNYQKLIVEIEKVQKEYLQKKKLSVYVFHREFSYLKNDLNIEILSSLEEVPGILPNASYLAKLAMKAKTDKPVKVLATNSSNLKILDKFKEMSGVDYQVLTIHPSADEDYLEFISKSYQLILK